MDGAWNRRLRGLALAALVFGLDQLVKWLVTGPLGIDSIGAVKELLPFFDLRFTTNFGISLGLFEAQSVEQRWLLVMGTGAIALIVLFWMLRERTKGDIFGLGAFRPFMIFNVADACITIGVLIILARSFFLRDKGAQSDMHLAAKES